MGIVSFDYMHRDEIVARVYADNDSGEVKIERYTNDLMDNPIPTPNGIRATVQDVAKFFDKRSFPRTRGKKELILNHLGLKNYNPYAIVKKTRGHLVDDYYWIRFDGDNITWDEVKNIF